MNMGALHVPAAVTFVSPSTMQLQPSKSSGYLIEFLGILFLARHAWNQQILTAAFTLLSDAFSLPHCCEDVKVETPLCCLRDSRVSVDNTFRQLWQSDVAGPSWRSECAIVP